MAPRSSACLFFAALLLSAALPMPKAAPLNPNTFAGLPDLLQLLAGGNIGVQAVQGVLGSLLAGSGVEGLPLGLSALLSTIAGGGMDVPTGVINIASLLLPLLPIDSSAFGQLAGLVPVDVLASLLPQLLAGNAADAIPLVAALLAAQGLTPEAGLAALSSFLPAGVPIADLTSVLASLASGGIGAEQGAGALAGLLGVSGNDLPAAIINIILAQAGTPSVAASEDGTDVAGLVGLFAELGRSMAANNGGVTEEQAAGLAAQGGKALVSSGVLSQAQLSQALAAGQQALAAGQQALAQQPALAQGLQQVSTSLRSRLMGN